MYIVHHRLMNDGIQNVYCCKQTPPSTYVLLRLLPGALVLFSLQLPAFKGKRQIK